MDGTVVCACDTRNVANTSTVFWDCEGTFPPISTPTLMPAGEPQPVSLMPVPTAPVPFVNPCPSQVPNTRESCDSGGFDSINCSYDQTISTGNSMSITQTFCMCKDNIWSCSGESPDTPETLPAPAPGPNVDNIAVIDTTPGTIGQAGCPSDIQDGTSCVEALGSELQLTCIVNGLQCNCADQADANLLNWSCRSAQGE